MLRWRDKFAVKHADCVIALSQYICRCYGKFNKRIFIVEDFVDEKQLREIGRGTYIEPWRLAHYLFL
jgi:hypothetical protein